MAFIFSGSSYLIAFSLPEARIQQLVSFGKSKNFRVFATDSYEELENGFNKIKHCLGCLIPHSEPDLVLKEILKTTNIQQDDLNLYYSAETLLEDFIQPMIPPGLWELAKFSGERTLGTFYDQLALLHDDFEFVAEKEELEGFDKIILCDTYAPPYVGRTTIRLNTKKILASFDDREAFDLDDYFKEYTNQYLGVLNYNLLQMGFLPSLGLPKILSIEEYANYLPTGPLLPSVSLKESSGLLQIEIGFIHGEGGEILKISEANFCSPEDEELELF